MWSDRALQEQWWGPEPAPSLAAHEERGQARCTEPVPLPPLGFAVTGVHLCASPRFFQLMGSLEGHMSLSLKWAGNWGWHGVMVPGGFLAARPHSGLKRAPLVCLTLRSRTRTNL